MPAYERKLRTTGYWTFVCNLDFWSADEWLALGEDNLFYRISEHHRDDMRPGQKGVLRVSDDRRSLAARHGRPKVPKGVYALFEIVGRPEYAFDTDRRAYSSKAANERRWRVPVKVILNALSNPLLALDIPQAGDFKYIHRPLQTSSIPLPKSAFDYISKKMGYTEIDPAVVWTDADLEKTRSADGLRFLEKKFSQATPKQRARVSKYIERGVVGRAVKAIRKGRCQLCEAFGLGPVAFLNGNGEPYSEAHHVIPVSSLIAGTLSAVNIMVLCPNHHRQAHFGRFVVVENAPTYWSLLVDDAKVRVEKTILP